MAKRIRSIKREIEEEVDTDPYWPRTDEELLAIFVRIMVLRLLHGEKWWSKYEKET